MSPTEITAVFIGAVIGFAIVTGIVWLIYWLIDRYYWKAGK